MKVAKFGGTSLASAEQFRKVGNIVASDPQRRIIVVSAPGRRHKMDTKVTDLLIACAEKHLATGAADREAEAVVARYAEIARGLGLSDAMAKAVADDLQRRLAGDASRRERFVDTLKAAGEDNCARLFAEFLRSIGLEASYVSPRDAGLLVSAEFGNAQVLPESYDNLRALRERPGVTVFPGFFGYSPEGDVVTFPRGGSDITGSVVAAGVRAELYENFTDVDSVFVASPGIVERPCPIPEITYREMRELSYAGFSVFHEEALEPAYRARIPVCIKNTNNPAAPGTMIVPERVLASGAVTGIACDAGFCSIYLSKYLMNREVGFGRRLLQILEEEGLSFEHCPSGIDNLSVILREKLFDAAKEARVVERIRTELRADDVSVERDLALVMIVGEGMLHTVGLAARATSALAQAGVNIEMINQGSSEVSMMFGIKAADGHRTVRALYREFFGAPARP
ncbi:MAG TPA: aspartate kinase [Planctomycetota bacterium]|nr:aspartate kinase [Planctomycetota bacterium]